jgi:Flp pilus assembly protein TadD
MQSHGSELGHRIGPAQSLFFYWLSMSAFRRGNMEVALKYMSHVCAQPETPTLWHRNHAEMLDRFGNSEAAEAAARLAVRRNPCCHTAWETLGTILVQRGALLEACNCYEHALAIEPIFFEAFNNLAVTCEFLGQFEAAEARYRQALRLAPANTEVRLNYAVLLRKLRRYSEGLDLVRQVLQQFPEMARANAVALEYARDLRQDSTDFA